MVWIAENGGADVDRKDIDGQTSLPGSIQCIFEPYRSSLMYLFFYSILGSYFPSDKLRTPARERVRVRLCGERDAALREAGCGSAGSGVGHVFVDPSCCIPGLIRE